MKKSVLKVLAIVLDVAMILTLCACTPKEDSKPTLNDRTNGNFEILEPMGGAYWARIHLYPNGFCTYCSFDFALSGAVGTYKIVGETTVQHEGADKTCTSGLEIYDLDGNLVTTLAYEDDYLYGAFNVGTALRWHGEEDRDDYTALPTTFLDYSVIGDKLSTFKLNVDGTYADTTGAAINGTWTKDGNTYNLTGNDQNYKVEVTSATRAVLTNAAGEKIDLYIPVEPSTIYMFTGANASLNLGIDQYSDYVGELTIGETKTNVTWKTNEDGSLAISVNASADGSIAAENAVATVDETNTYKVTIGGVELSFRLTAMADLFATTSCGQGAVQADVHMYIFNNGSVKVTVVDTTYGGVAVNKTYTGTHTNNQGVYTVVVKDESGTDNTFTIFSQGGEWDVTLPAGYCGEGLFDGEVNLSYKEIILSSTFKYTMDGLGDEGEVKIVLKPTTNSAVVSLSAYGGGFMLIDSQDASIVEVDGVKYVNLVSDMLGEINWEVVESDAGYTVKVVYDGVLEACEATNVA